MSFLSPRWLLLLLVVAALLGVYVALQVLGRRRYEVRFTNLALLASVAPRRPGWRRHVPAALLLLSLATMVLALARPAQEEQVPRERATIILAIDVSISMDATDVAPSRFEAAKQAAAQFTEMLPAPINLGLVAFAGTANVLVAPTTDRDRVTGAIQRLQLAGATAIGEAVLASLDAIRSVPAPSDGEIVPAHILVLSDGETTAGTPNSVAADSASKAGVPVTTIAFGTAGGVIEYEGEIVPVRVNEQELAELAEQTGGSAFVAATAEQLGSVYADIGSAIGFETELVEITRWFVGLAFALSIAAAVGSLAWFSRLP